MFLESIVANSFHDRSSSLPLTSLTTSSLSTKLTFRLGFSVATLLFLLSCMTLLCLLNFSTSSSPHPLPPPTDTEAASSPAKTRVHGSAVTGSGHGGVRICLGYFFYPAARFADTMVPSPTITVDNTPELSASSNAIVLRLKAFLINSLRRFLAIFVARKTEECVCYTHYFDCYSVISRLDCRYGMA